jgi:hypothetical protein
MKRRDIVIKTAYLPARKPTMKIIPFPLLIKLAPFMPMVSEIITFFYPALVKLFRWSYLN